MSEEIFPFGLSDKSELKKGGDPSIFHKDGTPHFVDFSPRVTPQPSAPAQPAVQQDPKEGSAQAPAPSQEGATSQSPSSETPADDPKQPAQPDATGGTTKSKASGTSKQTS